MNAIQLIGVLRGKLDEAKAKGFSSVTINSLDSLVRAMEADLKAGPMPDVALEEAKLEHASQLAYYTAKNMANLELFKSVIETTKVTIQSLILINGGSAVALLAFIGHLATGNPVGANIRSFALPLAFFVTGVGTAAFFAALICLAQKLYAEEWSRCARIVVWGSVIFGLASFGAFGMGSYLGYRVFAEM